MKIDELVATREKMQKQLNNDTRIVVGMSTCGIAAGAKPVFDTLKAEIEAKNIANVTVSQAGCIGMCRLEPIVEVCAPNKQKVTYVRVDSEAAKKIICEHIVGGKLVSENLITD